MCLLYVWRGLVQSPDGGWWCLCVSQSEAEKKAIRMQAVAQAKGVEGGDEEGEEGAAGKKPVVKKQQKREREVVEKKPKANDKPHRLNRKKRRRLQALAGEEAEVRTRQRRAPRVELTCDEVETLTCGGVLHASRAATVVVRTRRRRRSVPRRRTRAAWTCRRRAPHDR